MTVLRDPKLYAQGNLAVQFGLRPLIKDINTLLDVQGTVDRRAAELAGLLAAGGSKHTRTVRNVVVQENPTNQGSLGVNEGSLWTSKYTSYRRWIQVSWVPVSSPSTLHGDHHRIRRAAFRAALGLTIDSSTVWNALPWTWLIDWYSDFGNYLAASRNTVGFQAGTCYVMTHKIARTNHWRVGGQGSYTPPVYYRETKHRSMSVGVQSPTASVPFLSGRQLGILASLNLLTKRR